MYDLSYAFDVRESPKNDLRPVFTNGDNVSKPDGNIGHQESEGWLRCADREAQLEFMRSWFFERFEDPAESTPYNSAEGGYLWIWGGPYEARDELESNFSGIVPDDVLDELANELETNCSEWAPVRSLSDYDEDLAEYISQITDFYHNFTSAILDIENLLEREIHGRASITLYRLLYVNVITALETYLSDAFISTVSNSKEFIRKFVETTPEFQAEKLALSEIFDAIDGIESRALSYMVELVWHQLHRVKQMYRDTLGIQFPNDLGVLFRAILVRHDIVHRNGKTKSNEDIYIDPPQIRDLISAAEGLAQSIDQQLSSIEEGHARSSTKSNEED